MGFLNFALGDTVDMLREAVRDFADREILPLASKIDQTNQFPTELWPKLGQLGLLGVTVEEEYGGSGLGYVEHAVAMEEISRASASIGLSSNGRATLRVIACVAATWSRAILPPRKRSRLRRPMTRLPSVTVGSVPPRP